MKRAFVLLLALPLAAQDPDAITVNPNRPTFATPARTTEAGVLELEAGLQRSLTDARDLPAADVCRSVFADVRTFTDEGRLGDDLTILVMRRG